MAPATWSGGLPGGEAQSMQQELRLRQSWGPGSVLEVFSSSLGGWSVGVVTKVTKDDKVVVQFSNAAQEPLMKVLPRSDVQLATLGCNTQSLPPHFRVVPSQSRPGQVSYLDSAHQCRYSTPEAAWRQHFQDLLAKWQASGEKLWNG
ncbi:RFESD [Symbiodinium sp. CCMP2592]|nr:RFESD [Symbiodinium sp. CCMP2592]